MNDNALLVEVIYYVSYTECGVIPFFQVVDDRVGLTIGRRVLDMKRIGVPFIVVVGGKFKTNSTFELINVAEDKTSFLPKDELLAFLVNEQSRLRS